MCKKKTFEIVLRNISRYGSSNLLLQHCILMLKKVCCVCVCMCVCVCTSLCTVASIVEGSYSSSWMPSCILSIIIYFYFEIRSRIEKQPQETSISYCSFRISFSTFNFPPSQFTVLQFNKSSNLKYF